MSREAQSFDEGSDDGREHDYDILEHRFHDNQVLIV